MIEKNIHQIWIGEKRIPNHIKEWTEEIKEKHPDFTYYFWNDANLPILPQKFQKFYDLMPEPIDSSIKSDFLRIFLVYKYGGMYLDADFKFINGFHNSNIDFDNLDGIISLNDSYGIEALGCNFFGFKKQHLILKILLENIENNLHWLGPNYWSLTLFKHFGYKTPIAGDVFEKDLKTLNVSLLNTKELETRYFQHVPLASWYPNSEWNIKFKNNDYD